jgi:predicted GIY-YIG superfamily endonuclease
VDIAVNLLLRNNPKLKISKTDLKKLFKFATSGTQFLFNGEYYDQVDGVAMGSPLAPTLANLFLGYYEGKWIDEYEGIKPSYYTRYVDDIFAVFNNSNDASLFLTYLNTKHPNIKFTYEPENNNKLSFLDVCIDKSEQNIITRIYRKDTFSGVLTNYLSFTSMKYKIGLIRCLIDRVFKINSTWLGFHKDLKHLFWILKRNCYPEHVLQKVTRCYLDSKCDNTAEPTDSDNNERKVVYFKLPYLGQQSVALKSKIKRLSKKFCENIDVQLVFQSLKLSNFFSKKDKLPLKSHVVYKFTCSGCNSCYVGFTTRHFQTRVHEHLTDKKSHVFKHLHESANCLESADVTNFMIIDRASTEYELKIKESMHIKWLTPSINKQRKTFTMTLSV